MELTLLSFDLLSFLFLIAVLAGFIDTLAGGGGLITMPALLLSGVPPLAALGTNKLQGSMGTATATYMVIKKKKVSWGDVKYLMLSAFIGSAIGSIAVQFVNTEVLSFVIPVVLVLITVYFMLSPLLSKIQKTQKTHLAYKKYRNFIVPTIGGYDGMFGPGTGSFFALAGVACRGYGLILSTAFAKPLNFSTNVASLIVFIIAGQIAWFAGVVMMLGQVIGAWLGAHCLFKINPSYLRGIVILMCIGMLLKYCHSMGWLNFV